MLGLFSEKERNRGRVLNVCEQLELWIKTVSSTQGNSSRELNLKKNFF